MLSGYIPYHNPTSVSSSAVVWTETLLFLDWSMFGKLVKTRVKGIDIVPYRFYSQLELRTTRSFSGLVEDFSYRGRRLSSKVHHPGVTKKVLERSTTIRRRSRLLVTYSTRESWDCRVQTPSDGDHVLL